MTVARGRTDILRLIFGELLGGFLQAHQLLAIRADAQAIRGWDVETVVKDVRIMGN